MSFQSPATYYIEQHLNLNSIFMLNPVNMIHLDTTEEFVLVDPLLNKKPGDIDASRLTIQRSTLRMVRESTEKGWKEL